jgi:poly-beta-hydroxyalkanoate depolymerase
MHEIGKLMRFVGQSCGRKCNFVVRISGHHPSLPDVYTVSALFADNVWYEPDWVNARDLEPVEPVKYRPA